MVIKAVILDFGGTLASGRMDWNEYHLAIKELLNASGYPLELNRLKKAIGASIEELDRARSRGREKTFEEVYASALRRLGLPPSESLLETIHDLFKRHHESKFYPCTEGVLERLAERYKLAVISNTMSDQPRLMLEASGLNRYFDVIVCSRDWGIRKPNPEIFLRVLEMLGVAPVESVHVGDSVKADMEGALRSGITGIWIKGPEGPTWSGYAISSICELPDFLGRLNA